MEFDWQVFFIDKGIVLASSLFNLLVGLLVIRFISGRLSVYFKKKIKDPTIALFLLNIIYGAMILILSIMVLTKLGVPSASLLTVLGAGSLAIGLSIKDSLSNIASGIMLIFLRPFRIGDSVEAGGVFGSILQVNLFSTKLKTANNQVIYLPNKNIMNGRIDNYSEMPTRRIDLPVGVSYSAKLDEVKAVLLDIINEDERILKSPEPYIGVTSLADSAVIISVRPWVNKGDYALVLARLQETIKNRFDEKGIAIPYPQMDVHLTKES